MEKYYHFTSIDTLYNMLTSSLIVVDDTNCKYIEFWATGINALNDTTERDLFVNALIKEVRQYANNKGNTLTSEQEKELGKLCYTDLYVISLTGSNLSVSDELNMWRGYGGNGSGVCIEFDFSKVQPINPIGINAFQMEDKYILRECEYLMPEDITLKQDLIMQIYDALFINEKDNMKTTVYMAGIIARIAKLSPYYKHKAYESEHEWRIVKHSLEQPKYRKRGDLVIPYITYRIPVTAITSVKIGPCIKSTFIIDNLVSFIYKKLGPNIEIKYSDIPYRG
jgi:hypothetical protein